MRLTRHMAPARRVSTTDPVNAALEVRNEAANTWPMPCATRGLAPPPCAAPRNAAAHSRMMAFLISFLDARLSREPRHMIATASTVRTPTARTAGRSHRTARSRASSCLYRGYGFFLSAVTYATAAHPLILFTHLPMAISAVLRAHRTGHRDLPENSTLCWTTTESRGRPLVDRENGNPCPQGNVAIPP
jgi:hypothetical protein